MVLLHQAESSKQKPPPEFVAVILATTVGTRLFPLTSNAAPNNPLPKHLLPVAGVPLLYRLLATLQAAGFVECVVAITCDSVTLERFAKDHEQHGFVAEQASHTDTNNGMTDDTKPVFRSKTTKVTFVSVEAASCSGSAQALRHVSSVLKQQHNNTSSNLLVVPGDLVCLSVEPIQDLLHRHRIKGSVAACTVLLSDVAQADEQGNPLKESAKQKKGLLHRDAEEIDYIAVTNEPDHRLVYKQPKLDVEQDLGVGTTPKLMIPKALCRTATLTIKTEWNDVHCYVLSPWVWRTLLNERATLIQSIADDLVPLLIARQFRGIRATFGSSAVDNEVVQGVLNAQQDRYATSQNHLATAATTETNAAAEYRVLAHVADKASVFRSHTIASYLYANKEVAHQLSAIAAVHNAGPADSRTSNPCLQLPAGTSVKPKFQSVVLPGCTVGDKVTFKSAVVGRDCALGTKCRLHNVVLHDGATIGENTILQNTVVSSGARIGENCNLNDCQVSENVVVAAGTKKKGEAFE